MSKGKHLCFEDTLTIKLAQLVLEIISLELTIQKTDLYTMQCAVREG